MKRRTPAQAAAIRAAIARKTASSTVSKYKRGTTKKLQPLRVAAVRGRGAYKKDYGARLGSVIGEGVQEALSQFLPSITKVLGFGDYVQAPFAGRVKKNTLTMGLDPPVIQNTSMHDVILRHREYLGDVVTSAVAGGFTVQSYPIQPGLPVTFPWLSQVADSFEQYELRGMIFEFKSTSADALNSTNTALGTVIMATQYDVTRASFANKVQMENHEYASSARQSSSMLHPIECARSENVLSELFIRTGSSASADFDLRFTDFGNFQIATVGGQAASVNIGELWVTYEVRLIKPQLILNDGAAGGYAAHIRQSTGVTTTNPFGTITPAIQGNLGLTLSGTNSNVVNFPNWLEVGQAFAFVFAVYGTSAALANPTFTLSGFQLLQIYNADSQTAASDGSATSTTLLYTATVLVTAASPTITITGGTYPTGTVSSDFYVYSTIPLMTLPKGVEMQVHDKFSADMRAMIAKMQARISELEGKAAEKEEKEEKEEKTPGYEAGMCSGLYTSPPISSQGMFPCEPKSVKQMTRDEALGALLAEQARTLPDRQRVLQYAARLTELQGTPQ